MTLHEQYEKLAELRKQLEAAVESIKNSGLDAHLINDALDDAENAVHEISGSRIYIRRLIHDEEKATA
mgnify:CR=1 FL=1